ncbi:MAG: hypothetical protein LIP03_08140, partial [Bacteroidales bacterium]|nr:hypothetical protein [Bacteroidales bacterium]
MHKALVAAAALMALPVIAVAQGYYDDDIYYDSSKEEKTQKTTKKTSAQRYSQGNYRLVGTYEGTVEYPAADTYIVDTQNTRDVDEYNRHGSFLVSDEVVVDSVSTDDFANTRRIERFHNPEVVSGSGDEELQYYYYSEPATVNIYVQNDPWYYPYWSWSWSFGSPWYSWNWALGYYDPWWGPCWGWTWGPAWSWGWNWGWGPSYAWGWGGPAWG